MKRSFWFGGILVAFGSGSVWFLVETKISLHFRLGYRTWFPSRIYVLHSYRRAHYRYLKQWLRKYISSRKCTEYIWHPCWEKSQPSQSFIVSSWSNFRFSPKCHTDVQHVTISFTLNSWYLRACGFYPYAYADDSIVLLPRAYIRIHIYVYIYMYPYIQ